jgi:hypothetical protein
MIRLSRLRELHGALEITYVIYKSPPLPKKIKDFSLLPFKTVRPAWTFYAFLFCKRDKGA